MIQGDKVKFVKGSPELLGKVAYYIAPVDNLVPGYNNAHMLIMEDTPSTYFPIVDGINDDWIEKIGYCDHKQEYIEAADVWLCIYCGKNRKNI